jgi:hypothetical protein
MVAVVTAAGQATTSKQATAKPAAPAGMTKITWKCQPPNPANAIPVPDEANHAFVVQQSACTASQSDDVMGVKHKDGTAVEFVEATGNSGSGHGIFTATMANGDKIAYSYMFKGTMSNGKFQSGTSTWSVKSATGKFKGITGKGTCKATGAPDGSATHECSGTYAPGK